MSRLSPIIMSEQAREFLDAARREFQHSDAVLSFAGFFLAARSIELGLKSFLLLHGFDEKRLRNEIGHNLEKALEACRARGFEEVFQLSEDLVRYLKWVNLYYVSKDLEYVKTGAKFYPPIHGVLSCAGAIAQGVQPAVRRWRPAPDLNG